MQVQCMPAPDESFWSKICGLNGWSEGACRLSKLVVEPRCVQCLGAWGQTLDYQDYTSLVLICLYWGLGASAHAVLAWGSALA